MAIDENDLTVVAQRERPITSLARRSIVLLAVAVILIMIVLPAALVAAGT